MEFRETYEFQEMSLEEAKGRPGILGTIKGNFFFPNATSRNKRSYQDPCWENALGKEDTKRMLADRLMIGTVGHKDMSFDDLIAENKLALVTTKLEKRGNVGYGEADILDTTVGRNLFLLKKSGSKLAVSSKAFGEYKGTDESGNNIIDPDTFRIERFDVVVDPGFLDAKPELKEQFLESLKHEDKEESKDKKSKDRKCKNCGDPIPPMAAQEDNCPSCGKPWNIKIPKDHDNIKTKEEIKTEDIDMSAELLEKLTKENIGLQTDIATLTTKLMKYEGVDEKITGLDKIIEEKDTAITNVQTKLAGFEEFFKETGSQEEITKTLADTLELGKRLEALGTVDEIGEAIDSAKTRLLEYKALGTPDEISKALDGAKEFIKETNEAKIAEETDRLAATYGVEESKIAIMLETNSVDQVEAIFEDLKVAKKKKPEEKDNKDEDKDDKKCGLFNESLTDRMFNSAK